MLQIFKTAKAGNKDTYDPNHPPVVLRAKTQDVH